MCSRPTGTSSMSEVVPENVFDASAVTPFSTVSVSAAIWVVSEFSGGSRLEVSALSSEANCAAIWIRQVGMRNLCSEMVVVISFNLFL